MKGRIVTPMVALVTIMLVIVLGCDKKEQKTPAAEIEAQEEAKQSFITYETLRQWSIPAGGAGMEILVSEDATKEEVLTLANRLRSECLPQGFVVIQIFDSKEAYLHRDDPSYPHDKFMKHFLVDLVRNPKTGYDKTNWVAEGRDK